MRNTTSKDTEDTTSDSISELPLDDPDYYLKRSLRLQQNGYPVGIYSLSLSSTDSRMIRWHWHEEIEIDYITKGEVYITCNDTSLLAKQGDIVFINQNVKHFMTPAERGFSLQSIVIHPIFIFGFGQLEMEQKYISPVLHDVSLKQLLLSTESSDYSLYLPLIKEIIALNTQKKTGYELLTKAALLHLWKHLYDHLSLSASSPKNKLTIQDEQRVKQAILYIQEHFMEAITLTDISSSILVSKSECCRCFKRALNITPFEYLMKYRIAEASKRMHKRSQESISEIAGAVGFNNTSYFNKIFKKYMGCTPSQYRSTIKNDLSAKYPAPLE